LVDVHDIRRVALFVVSSNPSGKAGQEAGAMSAEENKNLVRREQGELWNHTGELDAAEKLFAAAQAEAAKQEAADFRQGFPDVVSTIEDLIAEGDKRL
jgi:hypothetical protein